jgi:hypothetical protein
MDGFVFWLGNDGVLNIYKIVSGAFVKQSSVTVFTTSITCTNVALVPGMIKCYISHFNPASSTLVT